MAGQIEAYRKEIFDFLRTVTIKFEPFADLMGRDYMLEHGLSNPHETWNPYYINLTGEYTDKDTKMEVYSLEEDGVLVPYDKNLILDYPKTAALYRIPRTEYTTLEERYPENIGLIRTIAYPIKDIQTAIDAPNLTLLAYDDTLLDTNERYDLVSCLKEFLDMMRERWWTVEYTYENMYATVFWALLWQHLPLVLLTRRFKNIRTPYVHTFHIWEYLKSRGMKDYRDVLTNNQALWLYRNLEWVLGNQGKNITLEELADNLLEEISVSLTYKDMYQETHSRWTEVKTTPEFLTFELISKEKVGTEQTNEINSKLISSGLEDRSTAAYLEQLEDQLSTHPNNILPTKFLELKKNPVNTANEQLMTNFFINTLVYRLSTNDLSFVVNFKDPYNSVAIDMNASDVVLLYSWAVYKSMGQEVIEIPNKFMCYLAFEREPVLAKDLDKVMWYNQHKYSIKSYVNIEGVSKILNPEWHARAFTDSTTWINNLADQFRNLLLLKRYYEQSNDFLYHLAMNDVFRRIRHIGTVQFNITKFKTYAEWFSVDEFLSEIEKNYTKLNSEEMYNRLANACFDALFPMTDVMLDEFVGTLRNMETIYSSVRDLFIQLCSYNVTFLETERVRNSYWYNRDPDIVAHTDTALFYDNFFNLVINDFKTKAKFREILPKSQIDNGIYINQGHSTQIVSGKLPVKYQLEPKLNSIMRSTVASPSYQLKGQQHIILKFKLHTNIVSCRARG